MEICDDESMSVCATPAEPQQEHILKCREELMWDMAEYAEDIYQYLKDAEVSCNDIFDPVKDYCITECANVISCAVGLR